MRLHFFDRARSRILVGRPEPRAQQLVAGEDVQAADSSSCRSSRGRSAPADGRRAGCRSRPGRARSRSGRRGVRLHEKIHQQTVHGLGRVADLVIAPAAASQFQPVQRALAGQRLIQIPLAAEHPQQRIGAQLLVVVEVFVAQRQPVDALRQHLRQLVLDQ